MPRDLGAVQDVARVAGVVQVAGVADVAEDDGPAPAEDADDGPAPVEDEGKVHDDVPGRAGVEFVANVGWRSSRRFSAGPGRSF